MDTFERELCVGMSGALPLKSYHAGLLISRGQGRHRARVLSEFVLIFVHDGTLFIQEEDQAFEVGAGQTLLLWPGRRHWGTADHPPDLQFYWLHFILPRTRGKRDKALSVPQHATVTRPDVLTELFRRYLDDQETGRLQPLTAGLLAWLILAEIADQRPVSTSDRTAAALAGRAFTYIRSHIHQSLTASDIAAGLGCNPQYLSRVFQRTYHHTLTEGIHRARLGYARHLLLHSGMNVNEIARACGFSDVRYFFRLFKRYEGITALAYRRSNAQMWINYE